MMKQQKQVEEFLRSANYPILKCPTGSMNKPIQLPDERKESLRDYLITREEWLLEECKEFVDALGKGNWAGIADALVDKLYFIIGTAVTLGIDLEPLFDLVHTANMKKFTEPTYRESDGKLGKPEGWKPPDIGTELERQWKKNK